jgi:hypothetical protein
MTGTNQLIIWQAVDFIIGINHQIEWLQQVNRSHDGNRSAVYMTGRDQIVINYFKKFSSFYDMNSLAVWLERISYLYHWQRSAAYMTEKQQISWLDDGRRSATCKYIHDWNGISWINDWNGSADYMTRPISCVHHLNRTARFITGMYQPIILYDRIKSAGYMTETDQLITWLERISWLIYYITRINQPITWLEQISWLWGTTPLPGDCVRVQGESRRGREAAGSANPGNCLIYGITRRNDIDSALLQSPYF